MARQPHALVIGGSLGGLFAGSLLRAAGWRTTVFERSAGDLSGRGAGLGITQELLDIMARIGAPFDPTIGEPVHSRVWLDAEGKVLFEYLRPSVSSAWARIYRPIRAVFPDEHYRPGMTLERVEQDARSVTAHFADGTSLTADLLVAADGSLSTVRGQYLPDVAPRYAGYVAWRGVVEESAVSPETLESVAGRIGYSFHDGELLLTIPNPGSGDEDGEGRPRIYFIWYRPTASAAALADLFTDAEGRNHGVSIPPPLIRPELVEDMKRRAGEIFAPFVAEPVKMTRQPLLQAISDLECPRLVFGRVALLGDAAFVARPHVAGGTAKAAMDAARLAEALSAADGDVEAALADYERTQGEFGRKLVAHSRALGAYIELPAGQRPDPEWEIRMYGAPQLLTDADPARFDRGRAIGRGGQHGRAAPGTL